MKATETRNCLNQAAATGESMVSGVHPLASSYSVGKSRVFPRSGCGRETLTGSQLLHVRASSKYHPNTDHI